MPKERKPKRTIKDIILSKDEPLSSAIEKASIANNKSVVHISRKTVSPKEPDNYLNKYIYVYTGGMPFITVEGITFERGVPTHLPMRLQGKLSQGRI
jgi:hypothetical protein